MRPQHVLSASLLAAALAVPLATASSANVVITVNKGTQRMLVAVDGTTRYEWPVSTGRPGYQTPNGTFKPNRMDADHHSNEYENAPMPHSIFFDMHGHAIHGFFDTPHLGLAVSHGCVRLSPANATTLFSLVKAEGMANTTVIIHGQIPARQAPVVARRQAPAEETAAAQPAYPAYPSQQGYYGQPTYGYQQPAYGGYQQRSFPPQPAPAYARPAYGQPYGYQPQYGGSYQPY
jgi:hypothetical protein